MNDLVFLAADCVKDCGGADVLRILKFVFILIDLVFFIVPIGLIIMLMIDFGKNVIAGKEDEMKKNLNMVIKRIIYCVVLFLVPTITNFVISLVGTDGESAVSKATACIRYAKEYTNEDLAKCEIDYENWINDDETQDETQDENQDEMQHKVTFYANGGIITLKEDGSTADNHIKYFDKDCIAFAVSMTFSNSAKIERTGYKFNGWNTKEDGSGEIYDGLKKWDCSSNLNLYAQWSEINDYGTEVLVSFDLNGGKGNVSSKSYMIGKKYGELPSPSDYEIDSVTYVFDGWYTKKEKGNKIADSSSVDAKITVLYAHWKAQYKVTFHSNGGVITSKKDGSIMTEHIKYFDTKCSAFPVSTTFSNSAKIERTGFTFVNWNTKADGSGTTYKNNNNWNCSSNLDLYAQWKKI